jgi:hypothetical protein
MSTPWNELTYGERVALARTKRQQHRDLEPIDPEDARQIRRSVSRIEADIVLLMANIKSFLVGKPAHDELGTKMKAICDESPILKDTRMYKRYENEYCEWEDAYTDLIWRLADLREKRRVYRILREDSRRKATNNQ